MSLQLEQPTSSRQSTDTFRVSVVVNGCSRLQGGLFHSVRRIWQEVHERGADVRVRTIADQHTREDSAAYHPLPVEAFPSHGTRKFNYSPELRAAVERDASEGCDLISNHGLWIHPSYIAHEVSRASRIPLIVHPEGMLEPWALQFGGLRKRVIGRLFQDRALNEAACVRALCPAEERNFRRYGVRSPVAVIPNGIDLHLFEQLPRREALSEYVPAARDKRRVLFLSRIHPKKGIVPLLRAWSRVNQAVRGDWVLIIAGPDELGHATEVQQLARELDLNDVAFPGPLHGAAKMAALGGADLFVLPSYSEGFSIALLEAAACGLPVLATPPCNFHELTEAGGALEVEPNEQQITRALGELLTASESDRQAMGAKGRALVRANYTWSQVGDRMTALCQWIIGAGSRPEFVSAA